MDRRRWRLLLVIAGLFCCYTFFRQANLGPAIKELTLPHHFPPLPPSTECVPFTAFAGRHLSLCVKPMEEDAVVSANIRFIVSQQGNAHTEFTQGEWEGLMLDLVLDAMESLPEAAFLDIGANIGVYTVAAAALRPAREVTEWTQATVGDCCGRRSQQPRLC